MIRFRFWFLSLSLLDKCFVPCFLFSLQFSNLFGIEFWWLVWPLIWSLSKLVASFLVLAWSLVQQGFSVFLIGVLCTWTAEICQSWGHVCSSEWYYLCLSRGGLLGWGQGPEACRQRAWITWAVEWALATEFVLLTGVTCVWWAP